MADLNQPKRPKGDDGHETSETLEKTRLQDERLMEVHSQLMREKDEPTEGFSPVPMALIFLFAGLSFWAGIYIVKFSGGFDPLIYDETIEPGQVAEAGPPVELPLFERGQQLYTRNCVACHQASGMGVPGAFPPLVESNWVLGSEERLAAILLHGISGPIEVLGNTYNGLMPAFANLGDRDIAAVLTYIRQSWGNAGSDIAPETVAQIRADTGGRMSSWSAEELLAQWPME